MKLLPTSNEVALTLQTLPKKHRAWLIIAGLIFIVALLGILFQFSLNFSETVAGQGGKLTEGIIGTPRFINPLLASADADRDLTTLIYSGLMRVSSDNNLIPDLAERYEVSEDGLTYTFYLRENLSWHDGKPLTTDDVEFTITKAKDSLLRSPRRGNWEGVEIEKVSSKEIKFKLSQPYTLFLENTTIGILPKHIWDNLSTDIFTVSQFNIQPIGSGPYQVKKIALNNLGIPYYYDLEPFDGFALGKPKIERLRLRFYPNEEALMDAYQHKEIDNLSSVSAQNINVLNNTRTKIVESILPRTFAIFLNQNKAIILANHEVREALDLVIDRQEIVDQILQGHGKPLTGPLPLYDNENNEIEAEQITTAERLEQARTLLQRRDWEWNEDEAVWQKEIDGSVTDLAISLTTAETPELKATAEMIKEIWEELGVKVTLNIYEIGDLNLNIIRTRQYEALLFGQIIGQKPDLFPFWHSSQRLDPGLNIALYTNSQVDKLLGEIRGSTSEETEVENYQEVINKINQDIPAIFLYSPHFLYATSTKVKQIAVPIINNPADRFLAVHEWYINTDRVWKLFVNENNKTK